jgi:hypothetical protein
MITFYNHYKLEHSSEKLVKVKEDGYGSKQMKGGEMQLGGRALA